MQTKSQTYYGVKDIMALTHCGKNTAYNIIRKLNSELRKEGYIVFTGRVPKIYADKRLYLEAEVTP